MITTRAPAKVNLVLEIVGKGTEYHDICSIAQTIDLCDTLTFEPGHDIEFTCSDPTLVENNLVPRAARLLQQRYAISAGARIHLEKCTPPAQGLGGGSSDAASTLRALNHMWQAGLSQEQLTALGAELGSDVPLFLLGGTVLMKGRGEQVSAMPNMATTHLVLFAPDIRIPPAKTAFMYGRIRPEMYTRGQFVRAASFALERQGSIPEDLMFNVFEKVTADVFPGLRYVRAMLEDMTGRRVHLTGSGPCTYALVDSEATARRIAFHLEALGRRAFAACTISAKPLASETP